jgi:hypothetical protein
MENVQKIGQLELLQWWYLKPSVYIDEQMLLLVPSKTIRQIPYIMEHKTPPKYQKIPFLTILRDGDNY